MTTLRVTVSDRLRIDGERPPRFEGELLARFDHVNPDIAKAKRAGRAAWHLPKTIRTWALDGAALVLPRGGTARLREVAARHGVTLRWLDERLSLEPVEFPAFSRKLFGYQRAALDSVLAREQGIIRAPTGCISGDALVGINRGGKSFTLRLRDLVMRFHGEAAGGKTWDPSIPTTVRVRGENGYVRLARLRDAWPSGRQTAYRLMTASGHTVEATAAHRFLTDDGWRRLAELRIGDAVYVECARGESRQKRKGWYHLTGRVVAHPYAGRRGVALAQGGWSVPTHRLVMEAALSKIPFAQFVARCRSGDIAGLVFLDPTLFSVHHRDENPRNNVLANLVVLPRVEHARQHGIDGGWKHVTARTVLSEVTELAQVGEIPTYDLELEAPHNFLANGIVVHNSGKTTIALAAIAEVRQPALVVMRDSRLLDQWKRRAVAELGLTEREIGVLRGGKRSIGKRLTLALQQTLNSASFPLEQVLGRVGAVFVDEAQTVAARTFEAPLNRFPARVRVGFSADETRNDRKEFLVYDTMGDVIHDVPLEDVEGAGVVVPVHVLVATTDFAPSWYADASLGERDWTRLMSEVEADRARNERIVSIVEQLLREGRAPVLVFTDRREHARALADVALFARGHRCGLLLGTDADAVRFTEDRLRLETGKLDVAVGTFDAIGQGIDLPRVRGGVIASPIGDNRQFFGQVRGRLARAFEGKPEAWLVYVLDERLFPRQLARLRRWNRGDVESFRRAG